MTHISQHDHTHQVTTGSPEQAVEDRYLIHALSDEHVGEIVIKWEGENTTQFEKTQIRRSRLRRQKPTLAFDKKLSFNTPKYTHSFRTTIKHHAIFFLSHEKNISKYGSLHPSDSLTKQDFLGLTVVHAKTCLEKVCLESMNQFQLLVRHAS